MPNNTAGLITPAVMRSTLTDIVNGAAFPEDSGSIRALSASYATTASYALFAANGSGTINTGSFATTGSNTFTGSQTISGSLSVSVSSTMTNYGSTVLNGTVTTNGGVTGSFTGSFAGDGGFLLNLPSQVAGNTGEIQYNNGGFGGVSTLTYDGSSLVTATNIDATGSFSGSFNGVVTDYVTTILGLGSTVPFDPNPVELHITHGGTYILYRVRSATIGYIYFPDPQPLLGQKITIQNRDGSEQAYYFSNGYEPFDITNTQYTKINAQTTQTFVAADATGDGATYVWYEI